jgi:hypothetical protein
MVTPLEFRKSVLTFKSGKAGYRGVSREGSGAEVLRERGAGGPRTPQLVGSSTYFSSCFNIFQNKQKKKKKLVSNDMNFEIICNFSNKVRNLEADKTNRKGKAPASQPLVAETSP